jgi:hypothetical protein
LIYAARLRGDVSGSEASRIVWHLARESDDAVVRGDVDRGRFQQRISEHLGLDIGGDRGIIRLVASETNEQRQRQEKEQLLSKHEASL